MRLIVSGLDKAHPMKFMHLFRRYVMGSGLGNTCNGCFMSQVAKAVTPHMIDAEYELDDRLFYLCGVGQRDSKRLGPSFNQSATNVHLAVRLRKGCVASTGSVYGASFTITDAQAIPIEPLPKDFGGLPEKHYRCKNFQFGYQTFAVDTVGHAAKARGVITQLRSELLT